MFSPGVRSEEPPTTPAPRVPHSTGSFCKWPHRWRPKHFFKTSN